MSTSSRSHGSTAAPGARPGPGAAGPGLLDLPDDVLSHVLSLLTHEERLRGPALACRRLLDVTNAPQLNASASLVVSAEAGVARLLSFCRWLTARSAGSVQRLSLRLQQIELGAGEELALGVALGACSGTLRHAHLVLHSSLLECLGSWVAALRNLRVLDLDATPDDSCELSCSLVPLAQLERLGLTYIRLAHSARLPPSLTALRLETDWSEAMPQQLPALTRLEAVSFCNTGYSAASMAPLARLPRLRRASFSIIEELASCLPGMTGLQQLRIHDHGMTGDEARALLRLTQLTCLALVAVGEQQLALAATVQRMPQLRALAWDVGCFTSVPLPVPLPGGPWLRSLQHLELIDDQLAASLPALAQATSLTQLSLNVEMAPGTQQDDVQQLAAALRCAAALPLLRVVDVYVGQEPMLATAPAVLLEALNGSAARLHWFDTWRYEESVLERLFLKDGDE